MPIPVEWEHFTRDLSPETAAKLFKKSVNLVAFAISSYCNRQCTYCPNVIADRKSAKNYMSDGLFFNILRQLSKIDYDQGINITRYNEPLADRDYALSRLRDIRVFLPKAVICIYTNGDYLDRSYLDEIAKLGVQAINATVHAGAGGKTDIESLILEQNRRLEELGLAFEIEPETDAVKHKYRIARGRHRDGLHITYAAHDFYRGAETGDAWAYDRGGSLPIPKAYVRKNPCFVQFTELNVEWDGSILPCCQIHNDVFDHDDYVLGKLDSASDIFAAWTNLNFIGWRLKMFNFDQKTAPCATCTYGMLPDTPELRNAVDKVRNKLLSLTRKAAG